MINVMFKCTRVNVAFAVNSYSCVHGVRCPSSFNGKFINCGSVALSSTLSQKSNLGKILNNEKLWDLESFVQNVPGQLWKRKSNFNASYSFVIHDRTAEDIVSTVMDSVFKKHKSPIVIELNPGLGLITKKLLKRGFQSLMVYNGRCVKPFKDLLNEYQEKIELYDINPFFAKGESHWSTCYQLFNKLESIKDNEVVVIAVSPNRLFYRRLIYFIIHISFSFCKNVEFYVTIPDDIYDCLMYSSNKHSRACDYGCFSLLFEMEVLNKYPRDYFLPLPLKDGENVVFVRLARKITVLSQDDFLLYFNFLKVVGSRKNNNVIGSLERWFPGLGPYLIAEGVSPTKHAFEYGAEDLLTLFQTLKEIPGYDESFSILRDYEIPGDKLLLN